MKKLQIATYILLTLIHQQEKYILAVDMDKYFDINCILFLLANLLLYIQELVDLKHLYKVVGMVM